MVPISVNVDKLIKQIALFRGFANLDNARPESLKQLYAWLIAPLKNYLKTPVVSIIPHGVLHYLPFAALTDGQQFLGDNYTLFHLPSASTLQFIQQKRKAGGSQIITSPGGLWLEFSEGGPGRLECLSNAIRSAESGG